MRNRIEDLRNHLFAALEGLSDTESPLDTDRARAIADVARVIVDTAKAEVAYMNATGDRRGTGFIALAGAAESAALPRLAPGAFERASVYNPAANGDGRR